MTKRYRSQAANYRPSYTPQKKQGHRHALQDEPPVCEQWTKAGWPEDDPFEEVMPWWKPPRMITVVDSKAPLVYTQVIWEVG